MSACFILLRKLLWGILLSIGLIVIGELTRSARRRATRSLRAKVTGGTAIASERCGQAFAAVKGWRQAAMQSGRDRWAKLRRRPDSSLAGQLADLKLQIDRIEAALARGTQ